MIDRRLRPTLQLAEKATAQWPGSLIRSEANQLGWRGIDTLNLTISSQIIEILASADGIGAESTKFRQ